MKPRLSYSSIALYQECRRKYKLQKIDRIYPRKRATYFVFGEAMHAFLEAHHGGMPEPLGKVDQVFAAVDRTLLSPEQVHALEIDRAIVRGISQAYPKFYSGDKLRFRRFVAEKEFTVPFQDFDYTGKIDALVEDAAGDWWVFETKTAAAQTFSADYLDRVKIDSQVSGYMYAAQSVLGKMPKGVIYNMVKKPSIRLKKGETKQAFCRRIVDEYTKHGQTKNYFVREEALIGSSQIERWKQEVQIIGSEIVKAQHYPATTGACIGKYGSCVYLEACITRKLNPLIYVKSK